MPSVLKVCGGTWENASRDKRELSVYRELGYDVAVMAKGSAKDKGRIDDVDGFRVIRYSTRPLGERVPNALNRFVSLFTWASFVRKYKPDVISGHDLLPGLTIGWISTWFARSKPKLIYDAHEFELGRNAKRGRLTRWLVKHLEAFLMKKCAFSIFVNDSIAEKICEIHHVEQKPLVLRSTPDYWTLDDQEIRKVREQYLQQLGIDRESDPFILLYHGALTTNRGIETLLQVVREKKDCYGVILGNGEKKYVDALHKMAEDFGITDRILFHEAVSVQVLKNYVGAADLSVMMIDGSNKSYYYSLPNKFFESIQAETPMVASSFPEMEALISQFGIGMTCAPDHLEDILKCVNEMHCNSDRYQACKVNLKQAKKVLCWENEKQVLMDAAQKLL